MKTLRTFAAVLAFFVLHSSLAAQSATVTGRVFNVATGFYLKNAEVRVEGTSNLVYTEDGGHYTITVPAGKVTLTASYASVQSASITIDATPDGANTADFEMKPLVIERAAPAVAIASVTPGEGEIVVMDRFVVTEERSGQARAIMAQRAADNAVTAIATDNFGELTQGAVGEFLKYMPGVTIDYSEDEANTVRVGGLDPKYVGFTLDGIGLASASSNASRANNFSQMSITGIESIEFHQTLLARMPANTPAGQFELKSKYAFDRRRSEWRFIFGLDGISDAIELGRSYMPDDRKHYRTYPGGQLSYGGVFLNKRLGIEASISRYANYRNNQFHQIMNNYLVPDPEINPATTFVKRNGNLEMLEGPIIRSLGWRDGPRIWTASAANLSFDYRITPHLTFSLRSSFTASVNEYFNIYVQMQSMEYGSASEHYYGPTQGVHPDSSLIHWIVDPLYSTDTASSIYQSNSYVSVETNDYLISPRLEYKKGPLQVNFRAARSYSRLDTRDFDRGRFRGSSTRVSGIGWEATRPSTSSPTWTLTQTAGTNWSQPENWGRTATWGWDINYSAPNVVKNTKDYGYIDLAYARRVFGHPVTFRAGGGIHKSDYNVRRSDNRFNYNGPDGRQNQSVVPATQNYIYNFDLGGKAGNINEQGWRANNQDILWQLYQENSEWFVPDAVGNFARNFLASRDLTERIDAAYFEATTRAGRFSFNAGLRFERTATDVLTVRMRPDEDIAAARELATPEQIATGMFDIPAHGSFTNIEAFRYQYYNCQRFPDKNNYNNIFISGGFKYDISKNLRFQFTTSQAILRPDYENLSGTPTYPGNWIQNVWVPNPKLKPEKTTKFYVGLQWDLSAASYIRLSAYRLDINSLQMRNIQITQEQAEAQLGYPLRFSGIIGEGDIGDLDEEEMFNAAAVYYRSTINAEGTRSVYGTTLEYNQQLTFLPGLLKGLSAFGSFTIDSMKNAETEEETFGRCGKAASGGIRYRLGRFNVQLRATWQDDALTNIWRPIEGLNWIYTDHVYKKARTIVDLSGGIRLTRHLELSFSVRNITNSPTIYYSNVRSRLYQYQVYGSTWNLSLKGNF